VDFSEVMDAVAQAFESVGVAIIAVGGAYALAHAAVKRVPGRSIFDDARTRFGRPLLLGLEVLVAADIIRTVTVDSSLENVLSLGILVAVRVILSFSLEIELDGMPPWRRAQYKREGSAAARKSASD
jgi:uncharacterized membrane protein